MWCALGWFAVEYGVSREVNRPRRVTGTETYWGSSVPRTTKGRWSTVVVGVAGAVTLALLVAVPASVMGGTPSLTLWLRDTPPIAAGLGYTSSTTAISNDGNYMYAATASGFLYSFGASGGLRWTRSLGLPVGGYIGGVSTDASGSVVAVAAGNHFELFNSLGTRTWSFSIGGVVSGGNTQSVALSRDGTALIGSAVGPFGYPTGMLYSFAVRQGHGELKWSYDWGGTFAVVHAIALNQNASRIGVALGNGYASGGWVQLFSGSGSLLWSRALSEVGDSVAMSSSGGVVAAGTQGYGTGRVVAYNGYGRLLWEFAPGADVWSLQLLAGGSEAAVAAGGRLYFLEAGSVVWSRYLGAVSTLYPNAQGNDVVVADDGTEIATGNVSGTVRLFDLQGAMLFSVQVPQVAEVESMSASPTLPIVWVGTSAGVLRMDGI